MKILGIDPGYGRCGFGVIEQHNREWQMVTHGVITTPKDTELKSRLHEIACDLRHIVATHRPNIIALEELFFAKSTTTALKVAEVRGVIRLIAAENTLSLIEVKPNEVKLALTGYGKADKRQMQEMVKTVFSLKEIPKPDDAADALAVAWCAAGKSYLDV